MSFSPPIAGIQAHDLWPQRTEPDSQRQPRPGDGRIMAGGAREEKEQGEARPAAEERLQAVAQQEGTGMVGGGVANCGIGIRSAPGEDRRAVDDEVAGAGQAHPEPCTYQQNEEHLARRSPGRAQALRLLRLARDAGPPISA
jgi:hypothetical protein